MHFTSAKANWLASLLGHYTRTKGVCLDAKKKRMRVDITCQSVTQWMPALHRSIARKKSNRSESRKKRKQEEMLRELSERREIGTKHFKGLFNASDKRFHSFLRVWKHYESCNYPQNGATLRALLFAADTPSVSALLLWLSS